MSSNVKIPGLTCFTFQVPHKNPSKEFPKATTCSPWTSLNGLCSTFPRHGRFFGSPSGGHCPCGCCIAFGGTTAWRYDEGILRCRGLGMGDESPNRGSLNLFLEKGLKGRKQIGKKSGRPIEALRNHLVGFFLRQSFCGPSMEDDRYMISIINVRINHRNIW